jgi:competence ComEA-like helix-hairpin-helix protein
MVLSVCGLVGLLAVQPLCAQSAQSRTNSKPAKPAAVVNLNTATSAELETLPGVGAKMAARIIEYRQKKGPFKKIEEILETSRSGPSLLSDCSK